MNIFLDSVVPSIIGKCCVIELISQEFGSMYQVNLSRIGALSQYPLPDCGWMLIPWTNILSWNCNISDWSLSL